MSAAEAVAAPRLDDGDAAGWRTVGAAMVALALGPSAIIILCFGVFLPALHAAFGWPVARIALG